MNVTVIGPNLLDQSHGSFHVHATGCADIKRRYPRALVFQGGQAWQFEAESERQIVEEIYGDMIAESNSDWTDYAYDVHILPCVKLPTDIAELDTSEATPIRVSNSAEHV